MHESKQVSTNDSVILHFSRLFPYYVAEHFIAYRCTYCRIKTTLTYIFKEVHREVDSVALGPLATRRTHLLAGVRISEESMRTHLHELPHHRPVRPHLLPPALVLNPRSFRSFEE